MPTAIDAAVVLGLAGKASEVFAEPGTYLSFPLAPIGFDRARLRALVDDPSSPEGQSGLVEFSLRVNELPDGAVWQPDGDRLWDVYGDVLAGAELAESKRAPEEEADYHRAYDLLYQTQPDGSIADAPACVAYEQHRDAYLAAAQEYNNRKGQAEFTADQAVRDLWTADEPILRDRVAEAEEDWAIAGHRVEVDNARRVLREFGSRSPLMAWAGYRKLFDPDLPELYFRTSIEGTMFLETGYFPTDVVDVEWPSMTFTRSELVALGAAAPAGLRSRLAGGSDEKTIDNVSFEYSTITVNRPWFAPEVFGSRAWRFHEEGRVLSDGASPPAGQCTAYVSGLVLVRNITITRRSNRAPGEHLYFLPTTRAAAMMPVTRPQPRHIVVARAQERSRRVSAAHHAAAVGVDLLRPPLPLAVRPRRERRAGAAVAVPARLSAVGRTTAIRRPPLPALTLPWAAAPDDSATDPNHVYVLAFVCRVLPKAPNPDPQLTWSSAHVTA
jgi:hypothetical protein